MPGLFRRHSNVSCFFCQSAVPPPQNPNNFRCPTCHCWNRYDSKGEIMSFEPAMQDESLNRRSFARRASPSKDRLPTMYGKGPFCHACQTNQMLIINLLANYLPSTESPQYDQRVAMLPEYRESLHARYPPVCEMCQQSVDDEIHRKDNMARVSALGGWLKDSKGKDKQRRVSASVEREKVNMELLLWRIRGCLWAGTNLISLTFNGLSAKGYALPTSISFVQPVFPVFIFLSLFWAAWDPTYASFRKAQIQGRDVRLRGKRQYNILQMIAWLLRFTTSILLALSWFKPHLDFLHLSDRPTTSTSRMYFGISLFIELSIIITSAFTLRLQRPPTIRLVDSKAHLHPTASFSESRSRSSTPFPIPSFGGRSSSQASARSTPTPADSDLLASLSLSSKPVITPTNPVFGLPSLLSSTSGATGHTDTHDVDGMEDDDMAMDWTPIHPSHTHQSNNYTSKFKGKQKAVADDDDGSWLRPQRFFAPEKPTGLEGLFERTKLADDDANKSQPTQHTHIYIPKWMYALSVVPIVLAFLVWKLWRGKPHIEYSLPYPSYSYHNSQHNALDAFQNE
ncbi:hypothetical protein EYR40_003840 [Pleurotus pulmonarius]|nr:hypothetical protein EYR40_003840 [Pleurotus pulmonarius]KAF4606549.1 hypothetical protein EYR38_000603 [Pleurotus pulmonarius]